MTHEPDTPPAGAGAGAAWGSGADDPFKAAPPWAIPGLSPGSGTRLAGEAERIFSEFVGGATGKSTEGQLVAMRRTLDRLEGLWMAASAEFDRSGERQATGHSSFVSWLRDRCRLAPSEATGRAAVAHSLVEGTMTARAIRDGLITWRHAQVIGSTLPKIPDDRRDEAEQLLVDEASRLDPGQLRRAADRLLHCFDRERADELAVRRLERRGLSVAETFDGMVSVNGLLDPITGATLLTALSARTKPRPAGADHGDGHGSTSGPALGGPSRDTRTPAQRRADALGEICAEWLTLGDTGVVGGVRPHLSVIVERDTLASRDLSAFEEQRGDDPQVRNQREPSRGLEPAQLSWVGPITASEAQMIGCDSVVSRIVMSGPSQVLDVGRATRTISPALRRAVAARDRTCAGPGCHRLPEQCDVHHIVFWENGGETTLSNTVLLCRYHHRMVHLQHWRVTMDTTGRRSLEPPS